ncbi:rhamnulokinase family protein [Microbacterium sp. NPDC076911]|uniref:rhamnulokinase n=1 Tax=Microbacterium sp. NPDC076911 TaxID=3154958 RepID=UPI003418FB11
MSVVVAAIDLGAESGRVAGVSFDGATLELQIAHRFAHVPRTTSGWLHWDLDEIWANVQKGLSNLAGRGAVASTGVDTWGLDYGLYGRKGELLGAPTAYRDAHRVECFDDAIRTLGPQTIYDATGIQLMEINSLFGLMAEKSNRAEHFAKVDRILMMPDVMHRLLSGSSVTEYTAASTSGMFDTRRGEWATELLDLVELPAHIMPEVVAPGTDIGAVVGDLAVGGLSETRVIAPPAHDTASAVLAIPDAGRQTLFISSGTWSLVGVVLEAPIINAAARSANMTNEGGYGGTTRFLRNVMGLWVLQECRRQWQRDGQTFGYQELVDLAAAEAPLRSVINTNAIDFLAPGDMPRRIQNYCRANAIAVPETVGQITRTIIDSLALSYRLVAEDIASITGTPLHSIAVVGGGGANGLLQQATADATGLPVVCWAREATALGNAVSQLRTLGELNSQREMWDVIRASTQTHTYEPAAHHRWHEGAHKLRQLERAEARRRGLEETEPTSLVSDNHRA